MASRRSIWSRRFDPEVIVLDIMMPKIDGITLLPRLREITQAPILMLTAKGGTDDKVQLAQLRAPTTTWSSRSSSKS